MSFDRTRLFTLDRTVGAAPMDLYGTGDDGQAVLSSGGKGMPEIYVNETDGSTPFRITLTIDGDEMAGKTVATAVPRNHYLPLALNLSDYCLNIIFLSFTLIPRFQFQNQHTKRVTLSG